MAFNQSLIRGNGATDYVWLLLLLPLAHMQVSDDKQWEELYHRVFTFNNNNNGNFYSALPINNFTAQGTYKSNTNNNITHTSSFKNFMPPKYTYQKAENQTIEASFALSLFLSLSLPPDSLTHTGTGHMQFYRRKGSVSSWIHRDVLWFVHWTE